MDDDLPYDEELLEPDVDDERDPEEFPALDDEALGLEGDEHISPMPPD